MKRAMILAFATLLIGCTQPPAAGGANQAAPLIGNPAVYQRIASESDCGALQAEFDTAGADHDRAVPGSEAALWSTAYMEAADARMKAVGCYK